VTIGPDTNLSPVEAEAVRAAARPYLQAALRKGLAIGFVLGAVAVCIVLAMAGGGR
jgi:hypothetical protein